MALLDIRGLKTHFHTDDGWLHAVDGVDIRIDAGETVCVVGESGCGKSVTALSIMRLLPHPPARVTGGRILFDGTDLMGLDAEALRAIRGDHKPAPWAKQLDPIPGHYAHIAIGDAPHIIRSATDSAVAAFHDDSSADTRNARNARQITEKGTKFLKATDEDLVGQYVAEDLVNAQTGEIWAEAGEAGPLWITAAVQTAGRGLAAAGASIAARGGLRER